MSFGVMAAGGNPEEGRREADFYSTPEDAGEAALAGIEGLEYITSIWEPACGDGRLCRVLDKRRPKWRIHATDLYHRGYGIGGVDFLTAPWPDHLPVDYTAIFTNPPFSHSEEFIRHALSFNPAMVVMFSKSTYYHAENRRAFFKAMPPRFKYDMTFRIDFSGQGRPTMECSWLVWMRGTDSICEIKLLPRAPGSKRTRKPKDDEWDIL